MSPVILSIAGFDPSSGAGITADVKTAAAHGCYAITCITAVTVQTTQGVFGVEVLPTPMLDSTLNHLADDFDIAAVRIGMLGSTEVAATVTAFLASKKPPNVVLDPIVRSSSGTPLLDDRGLYVLREALTLCDVVTPNIAEAAMLAGLPALDEKTDWVSALPRVRELAAAIHRLGAKGVVITGGHLNPANDYLSYEGGNRVEIVEGRHIESRSTHGTGCAYATSLACRLALGDDLSKAAHAAKAYVQRAIETAYPLGKGTGPVNHFR